MLSVYVPTNRRSGSVRASVIAASCSWVAGTSTLHARGDLTMTDRREFLGAVAALSLGAALSLTDSTTSAPLIRNYFAHPQPGDPVADGTPESSMESLQRRGVVFLLCNNALKRWSGR